MKWWRRFRASWRRGNNAAITIAFLLCAFITFAVLMSATAEDRGNQAVAQKTDDYYTARARKEAQASCGALTGAEKAKCVGEVYHYAYQRRYENQELYAARRSATWNVAMGKAAAIALIFNAVTVFAIFFSFDEQRRANRNSRVQLIESRKNAIEALSHARAATKLELRPYVFVEKITSEFLFERNFRLTIWLKNYGRTPARNIEAVVTTYVTRELSKLKPLRPKADHIALGNAAPDACRRGFARLSFGKRQWSAPPYDRYWGVIRISYTYVDDTAENEFSECVDYHISPDDLMTDDPTFFLLTDARIELERRWRAKQGELFAKMRSRTDLVRNDPDEEHAEV